MRYAARRRTTTLANRSSAAVRQSRAMTTRRDHRQTHVRPRPPSRPPRPGQGQATLAGTRPAVRPPRPIERSRGVPIVIRCRARGSRSSPCRRRPVRRRERGRDVAGGVGSTLGGFVGGVTSTPSPQGRPSRHQRRAIVASSPSEPYTPKRRPISWSPCRPVCRGDRQRRIYLALPDQPPTAIAGGRRSPTAPRTIIPVTLRRASTSSRSRSSGRAASPIRRRPSATSWTRRRRRSPSPRRRAAPSSTARPSRSRARPRHVPPCSPATRERVVDRRDGRGRWDIHAEPRARPGVNTITIVGTDPAGNVSEIELNGQTRVGQADRQATASTYQIKRSALPEPITLTATVTDPDGKALAGADVTFTLSIAGHPDGHDRWQDQGERQGVIPARPSRRAPTSARAARPSW